MTKTWFLNSAYWVASIPQRATILPDAECNDGTCTYPGCLDSTAMNYDPAAACDGGDCIYMGCTEIGNAAWAGEEQGVHPMILTTMEWGIP